MNRNSRLQSAKHWIPKYEGKNIVKGYSKYYSVDKLCAVKELEMLGIETDLEYIKRLKQSKADKQRAREERKRRKEEELEMEFDSDDTFSFIAGYTSGGAPYGIRWDEVEEESYEDDCHGDIESEESEILDSWEDDIPF